MHVYSHHGAEDYNVSVRDRAIMLFLALIGAIIILRPAVAFQSYSRGNFFLDNGFIKKAISEYQRAILLDPAFSDAYSFLGFAYKKDKQIEEAISTYNKALDINPRDKQVYFELGNIYLAQESFSEAAANFGKAGQLDPADRNSRNMQAVALQKAGRNDEALSIWQDILEEDPDYKPAKINLDKYR